MQCMMIKTICSKPLLWMFFYLTKKKQVEIKIKKCKKKYFIGFDNGFSGRKKKSVTIVL